MTQAPLPSGIEEDLPRTREEYMKLREIIKELKGNMKRLKAQNEGKAWPEVDID
jgi:hypothetical protein